MIAPAAGSLLRAHRERVGLTAIAVAKTLGVPEWDIHQAERGADIGVFRFVELCSAYRLRKGDIIDALAEYKKAGAQ